MKEPWRAWLLQVGILIISGMFAFSFFIVHFNNMESDLLSDNVYHRSQRPFVYRTLVPTSVNFLSRLVPGRLKRSAEHFVRTDPRMNQIFTVEAATQSGTGKLKFETHYPIETVVAVLLMFASLLGFLYTVGQLYRFYYTGSPWFGALVPAMAALGFVPWISYTSHVYDLTTLMLSSLLYWTLAKEREGAFLLIFFLTCINKETAILGSIVFATYRWLQGRLLLKRTLILLAVQIGIFVTVKTLISYLFRENAGQILEVHLFDINAGWLSQWLRRGYTVSLLTTFVIFVIAVCYDWTRKPLLFRSGLAIVPFLAVLGILFGVFDEWRQYTDAYTPLLMLVLGSIGKLFGQARTHNS